MSSSSAGIFLSWAEKMAATLGALKEGRVTVIRVFPGPTVGTERPPICCREEMAK